MSLMVRKVVRRVLKRKKRESTSEREKSWTLISRHQSSIVRRRSTHTWRNIASACCRTSRWSGASLRQTSHGPPTGGVYLHLQILALGLRLPLTNFIRDILCHFQVVPSQLTAGDSRTVLGFKVLYVSFASNSYSARTAMPFIP